MPEYRRPSHRLVARVLKSLDSSFLLQAQCYFGGGTQLALAYGEYRESKDIDLLCSSRAGILLLRSEVTQASLGKLFRTPIELAREVRADRDGIRTFLSLAGERIKLEIVFEGRIDLAGAMDKKLGIPVLAPDTAVAEKFLANTDRGSDASAQGRDLIDLAVVAAHLGKRAMLPGLRIAEGVYGAAVRRALASSLSQFQNNRARSAEWIDSLQMTDTTALRKGLRVLRTLT
jgi:hypothetical protein